MNILKLNNRIINLDHVSIIRFDIAHNKIFFNMNYAIQITDDTYIQDYASLEYSNDLQDLIENALKNIKKFVYNNDNSYINLESASSLKFIKDDNRIIVNLCNPHTYTINDKKKVIAEFIYIKNQSEEDFERISSIMENL